MDRDSMTAMARRIEGLIKASGLPRGTLVVILRDRDGTPVGRQDIRVQGFPMPEIDPRLAQ